MLHGMNSISRKLRGPLHELHENAKICLIYDSLEWTSLVQERNK